MKVLFAKPSMLALLLFCTLTSLGAQAQWQLDNDQSTVQFMSVKNGSVAELHHFKSMTGAITSDGEATVTLELDSVETLIPIRNERLREMLFETVNFPAATLSAKVPESVASLETGQSIDLDSQLSVEMHGQSVPYAAKLQVTRLQNQALLVTLREPLLVKASDFGLEAGIEALRAVAGLNSIGTTVPVSAQLRFSVAGR